MRIYILLFFTFFLLEEAYAQEDKRFQIYLGAGLSTPKNFGQWEVLGNIEPLYRLNEKVIFGLRLEKKYNGVTVINESIGSYSFLTKVILGKGKIKPYIGLGLGIYRITKPSLFGLSKVEQDPQTKLGTFPRLGAKFGIHRINIDFNLISKSREVALNGREVQSSHNYVGVSYSRAIHNKKTDFGNKPKSHTEPPSLPGRKQVENEYRSFQLNLGLGFSFGTNERLGWTLAAEPAYRIWKKVSIGFRLERTVFDRYALDNPAFSVVNHGLILNDGTFVDFGTPISEPIFKVRIGAYTATGKLYLTNGAERFFVGLGLGVYDVYLTQIGIFQFGTDTSLGKRIGFHPRVGFASGHSNLTLDFNIVDNSDNPLPKNFNYLSFRYSFFLFGGKK